MLNVSVPTATLIGYNPDNPREVLAVRFATKHGGQWGLPGGRVDFLTEDFLECICREANEEVGASLNRGDARLLPVVSKPNRDTRRITGKRYNHDADQGTVELSGHYAGDIVVIAPVRPSNGMSFVADGTEIAQAGFVHIDDLAWAGLILDFGGMIAAYGKLLERFPNPQDLPEIMSI